MVQELFRSHLLSDTTMCSYRPALLEGITRCKTYIKFPIAGRNAEAACFRMALNTTFGFRSWSVFIGLKE